MVEKVFLWHKIKPLLQSLREEWTLGWGVDSTEGKKVGFNEKIKMKFDLQLNHYNQIKL